MLIPDGLTCIVSTGAAQARTVEVESGAELWVISDETLHIITPDDLTNPDHMLKVDGTLLLDDEELTTTLKLGMTGTGTKVFAITGSGDIIGGPGEMIRDGSNLPDRVYVGSGITFSGDWLVEDVPLENDGTFEAGAGDTIEFFNTDWQNGGIAVSGEGTFVVNGAGGLMDFDTVYYSVSSPAFAPNIVVSNGTMHFTHTLSLAVGVQAGGTIDVSGGFLDFDRGLSLTGDGTSAVDLTVSGGYLNSDAEIDLITVHVAMTGGTLYVPTNIELRTGGSMLVEGGTIATSYLHTESEAAYTLTLDGGTLGCDYFRLYTADLNVESGLLQVNGESGFESNSNNLDITISGGTMKVGGGYDGPSNSNLAIYGGTLEIIASDANDEFHNEGEFFWSGGTMKVKQGEKITIE